MEMKETGLWILFFINYILDFVFAYVNAISINAEKLYMFDLKQNSDSLFIKNNTVFSGKIVPNAKEKAKYNNCFGSDIYPMFAFITTIFILVIGLFFRNNIRVLILIGLIFLGTYLSLYCFYYFTKNIKKETIIKARILLFSFSAFFATFPIILFASLIFFNIVMK